MISLNLSAHSWLNAPAHAAWRLAEAQRLLAFAKAAKLPDGFGNLDAKGQLTPGACAETMNTARMTHCFALAHLQGIPGSLAYAEHGVAALRGAMQDASYGAGSPTPAARKTAARPPTCMPSSPLPPALQWWPVQPTPSCCWPMQPR